MAQSFRALLGSRLGGSLQWPRIRVSRFPALGPPDEAAPGFVPQLVSARERIREPPTARASHFFIFI